jgi:hypothetical protein
MPRTKATALKGKGGKAPRKVASKRGRSRSRSKSASGSDNEKRDASRSASRSRSRSKSASRSRSRSRSAGGHPIGNNLSLRVFRVPITEIQAIYHYSKLNEKTGNTKHSYRVVGKGVAEGTTKKVEVGGFTSEAKARALAKKHGLTIENKRAKSGAPSRKKKSCKEIADSAMERCEVRRKPKSKAKSRSRSRSKSPKKTTKKKATKGRGKK